MGQGQELQQQQERPYTYGDVFAVSDKEVAQQPVAPKDAAAMQSSETKVLGHTQKGGPAAVMQSAAAKNVESGRLPRDAASDVGVHQGMTVTHSIIDGRQMTIESVGDQVVAQDGDPNLNPITDKLEAVTVGEALEASALSAADMPITQSDAAAIQAAAELVALGSNQTPPGGHGSEAHAAANHNSRVACDEEKTTSEHVLKYGDVFPVSEEVAKKPIAPKDAAAMQSAENQVLGETQKGGPASVMQSAATKNVQAGVLPRDAATQVSKEKGMTVTESFDVHGRRIITESIGDQVVAKYAEPNPNPKKVVAPPVAMDRDAVTIGEALEASALSAGDKPVSQSDAAAIQAAEVRAIGSNTTPPGGLAAEAQSAATRNQMIGGESKTTVSEVLEDATIKLPDDKPANIQDAEKVIAAELRNNPKQATEIGGVAESVAAAARLNRQKYGNDGQY